MISSFVQLLINSSCAGWRCVGKRAFDVGLPQALSYLLSITEGIYFILFFQEPYNSTHYFLAVLFFISSKVHSFSHVNISEIEMHSTINGML